MVFTFPTDETLLQPVIERFPEHLHVFKKQYFVIT